MFTVLALLYIKTNILARNIITANTVELDTFYVEIKCQLVATDDFYCRSYCLLNMFRAPLCPSSGARELMVMCPVCGQFDNLKTKAPNTTDSNLLYDTLELLMMGIMVPKTC
jgi:hypothetical protein